MTPDEIWHCIDHKLIGILRGITPPETEDIVVALLDAGFRAIEIPLNSPDPFTSIEIAVDVAGRHTSDACLIGAGTALSVDDVENVHAAGGNLIVSPNIHPDVVRATRLHEMASFPGVFTATEAHLAIRLGATGLKFFPASLIGPSGIKAVLATLPEQTQICAVGGIGPDDFEKYLSAGVHGFGLGSNLYRPKSSAENVFKTAVLSMNAMRK